MEVEKASMQFFATKCAIPLCPCRRTWLEHFHLHWSNWQQERGDCAINSKLIAIPHILEKIFVQLDLEDLGKCRQVIKAIMRKLHTQIVPRSAELGEGSWTRPTPAAFTPRSEDTFSIKKLRKMPEDSLRRNSSANRTKRRGEGGKRSIGISTWVRK